MRKLLRELKRTFPDAEIRPRAATTTRSPCERPGGDRRAHRAGKNFLRIAIADVRRQLRTIQKSAP